MAKKKVIKEKKEKRIEEESVETVEAVLKDYKKKIKESEKQPIIKQGSLANNLANNLAGNLANNLA